MQKHLRPGGGRRRGLRRDGGTLRESTLKWKRRVLPAPGSELVGLGLGASPPPWRVRAAGPGTRRHSLAPAAPRPRAACGAKPPPRAGIRPRFLRGEGSWRKERWRGVLADFTSRRKAFVGCSAGRHPAHGAAQGAAITWLPAAGSAAAGGGARAQPSPSPYPLGSRPRCPA